MRILLDECVPADLKPDILGHEVSTVTEMGWAGTSNGKLLALAQQSFDVLLTADRSIEYQQNMRKWQIALVVLIALDTRPETLRPLIPSFLQALPTIERGVVTRIS